MSRKSKAQQEQKLSDKEVIFVREYIVDFNGAAAVRRAGYEPENARYIAHALLTKVHIVDAINRHMRTRIKEIELNSDFTLKRLKALASSNVKNVAQWAEGILVLKDSAAMTEEEAYGIESMHMKQTVLGPEIRIKMRQPQSSLELLGRHQGLFDVGDQTKPSEELNAAIDELNKRESKK